MNANTTYFFAGTYGVGKSTVCATISKLTGIPDYSASELISGVNGEQYGINKIVQDKNLNQNILVNRVKEIMRKDKEILLSGHFCIFSKNVNIEILPKQVYTELNIKKIILLEADIEVVLSHLEERDNKIYNRESLRLLQQMERNHAQLTEMLIKKPLLIHKMKFDSTDVPRIIEFIVG